MAAEHDIDIAVQDAFFAKAKTGVIVEVGAARPDYLSISASFRDKGWKVIAVEPNPEFADLHRAQGHEVLQYAAGEKDEDDVDFFVVDSHGAGYMGGEVSYESFSSLGIQGKYADLHSEYDHTSTRQIQVSVRRLDTLLAEHEPDVKRLDVVAVDVEGWELGVMRGLTLSRFRPKVVILENLFTSDEYVDYMRENGYRLWARFAPNDIYIPERKIGRVFRPDPTAPASIE